MVSSFICSTQQAFPIGNNISSPANVNIKRNNFINNNIHLQNDRIACLSNISIRNNSEDINDEFPDLNISLFALYEGKFNSYISNILKTKLHQYIFEDELFLISTYEAIKNSFLKIKNEIIFESKTEKFNDKSLANALIVIIIENSCYIINLGISRCIMSTSNGNNIYQLNYEHNLSYKLEKNRLINLGYTIKNEGIQKLEENEFESYRCFSLNLSDVNNYINSEPDILNFEIKETFDFIIICNKGVYNYLTNDEIIFNVYNVLKRLKTNHSLQTNDCYSEIIKEIIINSMKKGNSNINIDIIIIFFDNFVNNFVNPVQRSLKIDNVCENIKNKMNIKSYDLFYYDFIENQSLIKYNETIYNDKEKDNSYFENNYFDENYKLKNINKNNLNLTENINIKEENIENNDIMKNKNKKKNNFFDYFCCCFKYKKKNLKYIE